MPMRARWGKAKMKGKITSYEQLAKLVDQAKFEPVRVHIVWCPDSWEMCSGTITEASKVRDEYHCIQCFDVLDYGADTIPDAEFQFEFAHTKGFYKKNRYFTNYWLALAYYLRMKAKSA